VLTNGRGGLSGAEMALLPQLEIVCRFVRAGGWQEQWRIETPTVTGKRLGILGLGKIGSRIAPRAAHGFDKYLCICFSTSSPSIFKGFMGFYTGKFMVEYLSYQNSLVHSHDKIFC
jgi:lactate dehydrogenase-like 2-hydroxyacid dehydrogenase